MFQSGRKRINAEDEGICEQCKNKGNCTCKHDFDWRYVVGYCQKYNK
jgi:hypothetical protein